MTWHTVMEYAHQGVELRNLPGLPPNSVTIGPRIAAAEGKDDIPRPAMLTSRGVQVLSRIERLFDEAARVPAPAAARAQGQQTELETVGPRGIVAADQGREAKVGN
jgi:penicillin-binding protein 1A